MTEVVQQLGPQIWSEIQTAHTILLHCHVNPDPDSLGSALALKEALEQHSKKVTVISGDNPLDPSMSAMPGYATITQKNYFELNNADYDLFIILDSSAPDRVSRLQPIKFPPTLKTIVIDHHSTNTRFAQLNLVDATYTSTCELLVDLFELWHIHITASMAADVMCGMYTDTGGFKYKGVTAQTIYKAARLAEINPDFSNTLFELENSFAPGTILYKGLILSSTRRYFSGKVSLARVTYDELVAHGVESLPNPSGIANELLSERGCEIAIALYEDKPGQTRASFRTRDPQKHPTNVIGQTTGFGSGHPAASGLIAPLSTELTIKLIVDTIAKLFPDLGNP